MKTKKEAIAPRNACTKIRIYQQMAKVVDYFSRQEGTMLDCSLATGIFRANICRYIPILMDAGKLIKVRKGIDRTTKNGAWYYRATSEKGGEA